MLVSAWGKWVGASVSGCALCRQDGIVCCAVRGGNLQMDLAESREWQERQGDRAIARSGRSINNARYSSYVSDESMKNGCDASIVKTCGGRAPVDG